MSRGAYPDVEQELDPRGGIIGSFTSGGDIPPNGKIALSWLANPGTFPHELQHAVDRQFRKDDFERTGKGSTGDLLLDKILGRPTGPDQFQQAYRKMRGYDANTGLTSQQKLAALLDPNFVKKNSDYRASSTEIPAFGVGNMVNPWLDSDSKAPNHLDATMATEAMILLDLAKRKKK